MTLIVEQVWQGAGGRDRRTGEKTLTTMYQVKSDTRATKKAELEVHPDIPDYGDGNPDDASLYVADRYFRRDRRSPLLWFVTISWTNKRDAITFNPLTEPTRFRIVTQSEDEPILFDKDEELYANSAGDRITGATRRTSYWVVTATKNLQVVPAWLLDIQDNINASSVTLALRAGNFTIPAKKMRIEAIEFDDDPVERNGIEYFPFTIVSHVRRKGWQKKEVDRGFRELGSDPSERIKITNSDGTDITEPALLDGSGNVINDPKPSDAVILTKDVEDEYDFSSIPHFA